MKFQTVVLLSVAVGIQLFGQAQGHGKLMNPPSRSSIWRLPEFAHLNPIPNYSDNELYCGGVGVQHPINGGKCGECGDRWDADTPRENELGGKYGQGYITREYSPGQVIEIEVDLNAAHLGYFEFRVCDQRIDSQDCLDRHLLEQADGSGAQVPIGDPGIYKRSFKLPTGLVCEHCVLQWHYHCGNTWGECEDGSFGLGCGPQETFRGCADIRIQ